jgi:zinc protease
MSTNTSVAERIFRPQFADASFSRLQKQTIEGFKQSKSQPSFIASQNFDKIIYKTGNFLTISESGTEQTIKNLSIKDVRIFTWSLTSREPSCVVGDVKQNPAETGIPG